MQGTFRLRRQTSRWARFAEVTVQSEPADEHQVVLDADIFAWRRTVYGPRAFSGGTYDEELCAAARDGAWYALNHLPATAATARIRISEIIESMADTTPQAVKFAAAHAAWRALDHEPAKAPWIDQDGHAVFPE
jgi:hypothetical protein